LRDVLIWTQRAAPGKQARYQLSHPSPCAWNILITQPLGVHSIRYLSAFFTNFLYELCYCSEVYLARDSPAEMLRS
jgi:hypothetical protein